ncbi:hypothetical protein ACFVZL_02275 [Streptomyces sp. NPDC058320]
MHFLRAAVVATVAVGSQVNVLLRWACWTSLAETMAAVLVTDRRQLT